MISRRTQGVISRLSSIKADNLRARSISFKVKPTMASSRLIAAVITFIVPALIAAPVYEEESEKRSDLEFGDKFQGDIFLTPEQEELINQVESSKFTRTGLVDEYYRWPKNSEGEVVVPYMFQTSSGFSKILSIDPLRMFTEKFPLEFQLKHSKTLFSKDCVKLKV
jgi:hypothetical protein